jgi:hypothetical protein
MTDITSDSLNTSATPLARVIDKWIWVFMAALFIAITLIGFIPDSVMKMGLVDTGQRPPFPLVLHAHAVLMGSFLLFLLTQSVLMATGHRQLHQSIGILGALLAVALVIVGLVLVPTMYHQAWDAAQVAPPEARAGILQGLRIADDIMLLQLRIGILFPVFVFTALAVRKTDSSLHKRFMFLAVAMALPAAFDRITWIPGTMPMSPLSPDLYVLLAVSPIFIWDLMRTHKVHKAYLIWLGVNIPLSIFIHTAWDSEWWHGIAPKIVGL